MVSCSKEKQITLWSKLPVLEEQELSQPRIADRGQPTNIATSSALSSVPFVFGNMYRNDGTA